MPSHPAKLNFRVLYCQCYIFEIALAASLILNELKEDEVAWRMKITLLASKLGL